MVTTIKLFYSPPKAAMTKPPTDGHVWVSTTDCCSMMGISRETLRRQRIAGLLKPGIHYRSKGFSRNSPHQWNLEAIGSSMTKWAKVRNSESNKPA